MQQYQRNIINSRGRGGKELTFVIDITRVVRAVDMLDSEALNIYLNLIIYPKAAN